MAETPVNNHRRSQRSLNNDELFELFSWLPAKSIVKFSALSKTLAAVFSEPLFIHNQSTRSSATDVGFFLQPESSTTCLDSLELHPPPSLPPAAFGVPPESLEFMARTGRVVSSSGGLVLIQKTDVKNSDDGEFLICNPATGKWAPVGNPKTAANVVRHADGGALVACGARKGKTGTRVCYIVVPVLVEDDEDAWSTSYRLAVFSDRKWEEEVRELKVEGRELRLDMPVGAFRGCNGGLVIHYLCDSLPDASRTPVYSEPYVVAYDVERRAFTRTMKLPEGAWKEGDGEWGSSERLRIFGYPRGDSVILVRMDRDGRITVWVMEDYDGGVWRRVVSRTAAEMGVEEGELGFLLGCCAVAGDRVAVVTRRRVYGYVVAGEEEGRLEVMGEHGCGEVARVKFTPYANTLEPVWGEETGSCFCVA